MSETAPVNPVRTRGPYLTQRKRAEAEKAVTVAAGLAPEARTAEPRRSPPRTAADIPHAAPRFETPQTESRTARRDDGMFSPDYDGPAERISRTDRDVNQFELPKDLLTKMHRSGWDARWIVITVLNQPVDGTELLTAHNAGWRAAAAKDFAALVPPGTAPKSAVERFGQRLYIRPLHMTRKAQAEDAAAAREAMQSRMAASQEGRLIRNDEEGLSDMQRLVRPVSISLEVEGEAGTRG